MSKEHALDVDLEGMTCSLLLQLQHTNQCVCEGCKVYVCTAECKQVADIESGNKAYCQTVLLWFHNNLINFTDLILENKLLLRSLPRARKY